MLKAVVTSANAPAAARVSAANAILDRGWGKPKESVDHTVRGRTLEELVLGQGANRKPGGRPKKPATIEARKIIKDIKEAARELTQEALDALKAVVTSANAPAAAVRVHRVRSD